MKNFKLELLNFKQRATIDQLDVMKIVENHINHADDMSEKEILHSLSTYLKPHTYDKEVKGLLESLEVEVSENTLLYNLKDLYKKIERKQHAEFYRQPLIELLKIINTDNDDTRMEAIFNNLTIYDYVNEIKHFILSLQSNPMERQNLMNTGKANHVFTIVDKVEEGHLCYIMDRWFLISEQEVKQVLLEDYIKENPEKINEMRILEKALNVCNFSDSKISFKID